MGDLRFKIDETGNESLVLSDISKWNGSGWVTQAAASGFDYAVNTTAVARLDGTWLRRTPSSRSRWTSPT